MFINWCWHGNYMKMTLRQIFGISGKLNITTIKIFGF